jgi:lipoprotein signal peptidase
MTAPRHLVHLARLALLVAACDLATKYAAAAVLPDASIDLTAWLKLALVLNDKGPFGISLGSYTRQLNLAVTLCAIALIVPVSRDLARIDRWAPTALGLIMGGALGNLTSMILSARGVIDFISVRTGEASAVVLNVADVAAYAGLGLLCRTGFLLVDRIRLDMQPVPALAVGAPALALVRFDREVAIPLVVDQFDDRMVADSPTLDGLGPRTGRRLLVDGGHRPSLGDAAPRPDELGL